MRALIFIPLTILLVCGAGYALCSAVGWQPYPREMLIAAATCLAAGVLAVVPLLVLRFMAAAATPANVAPAALVGTIIHLFVCIGVAAVVLLLKMQVAAAFTYWLMPLYWTTLLALAIGLVTEVRAASAHVATHRE